MRSFLKKSYASISRIAWYLGGQKEHRPSRMAVPPGSFVSEEATLVFSENLRLGENVLVLAGARLICSGMPPYLAPAGMIEIGPNSVIREGAILQCYGGTISTGSDCTINPYCLLQGNGGIKIGNNVLIASHVGIFSANHVFEDETKSIRSQGETRKGIEIEDDVWISSGAKILDGVKIGRGSVIAAGAVVHRNVPPFSVYGGVPARMIGKRGRR